MLIIGFVVCCFIVMLSAISTKDLANPVFISGAIWAAVYLLMMAFMPQEYKDSIYVLSFCGALIFFWIGFSCVCLRYKTIACSVNAPITLRKGAKNFILIICDIIAIYQIAVYIPYLQEGISFFRAVRNAQRMEDVSTGISGIPLEMAFLVMLAIYLINPSNDNKKNLLLSLPCLFSLIFTSSSRGGWFFLLISVVFLIVYIKRIKNIKIIAAGVFGIVAILLIFAWTAYDYTQYVSIGSVDAVKQSIANSFKTYFALPAIAFVDWCKQVNELQGGKYTFRFFYAVLHKIYPQVEVVDTIMPFYSIDGLSGNVFTALHWYALDFGVWWSLVINFALGILYGFLYKKCRSGTNAYVFYVIMLSTLMTGIAYEFFSEVLFSNLSAWIQRAIILFVMTLPGICVVHESADSKKKIRKKRRIRFVWGKNAKKII